MPFDDDYSSEDEEDVCPLCIEEMDISDRSFKPCPCGFQVCQFCYNKIRQSLEPYNRCPACRRPYTDEAVEYKQLTPLELKKEQERKHRKEQERKQREREKNKEMTLVDPRDKKSLSTIRVIQKNLVYVIGLNPNIPSDELQQMLRRDEYFGQYGKIQKIVINRRVNAHGVPGIGVYVTFARKEDAARCIAAVDGTINDGKQLRAAYGTTKYCSNYLRGQNCPNANCMYLHEPGEEVNTLNKKDHLLPHPSSATSTPPRPSSAATGVMSAGSASIQSPQTQHSVVSPIKTTPLAPQVLPAASVLPPWSKATTPVPLVTKIEASDLPDPAKTALATLNSGLNALAVPKWELAFNSQLLTNESKFPAMFSLPMDEKRRVKVYTRALQDLDKIEYKDVNETKDAKDINQQQQQQQQQQSVENGSFKDKDFRADSVNSLVSEGVYSY